MSKIIVDLNDLTLGQMDEASRLVDQQKISETLAFTFIYLKSKNPETTIKDVSDIKLRDIKMIPLDEQEDTNLD